MVIGGAAVLVPGTLPMLRRRLGTTVQFSPPRAPDATMRRSRHRGASQTGFRVKQAVVKTITYRLIVTTLDFTTKLRGDAGNSPRQRVCPPSRCRRPAVLFCSRNGLELFGSPSSREGGRWGTNIDLSILCFPKSDPEAPLASQGRFTINRAVAKTIHVSEPSPRRWTFAANYVVIGELATAVALTAVGFVFGRLFTSATRWRGIALARQEQTNGQGTFGRT